MPSREIDDLEHQLVVESSRPQEARRGFCHDHVDAALEHRPVATGGGPPELGHGDVEVREVVGVEDDLLRVALGVSDPQRMGEGGVRHHGRLRQALASPLVDDYRSASLTAWSTVAPDWAQLTGRIDRQLGPAADWIIQALALQPGESVLELAGGPGHAQHDGRPRGGALRATCSTATSPSRWWTPPASGSPPRGSRGSTCRRIDAEAIDLPDGLGRRRGLPDGLHADGGTARSRCARPRAS